MYSSNFNLYGNDSDNPTTGGATPGPGGAGLRRSSRNQAYLEHQNQQQNQNHHHNHVRQPQGEPETINLHLDQPTGDLLVESFDLQGANDSNNMRSNGSNNYNQQMWGFYNTDASIGTSAPLATSTVALTGSAPNSIEQGSNSGGSGAAGAGADNNLLDMADFNISRVPDTPQSQQSMFLGNLNHIQGRLLRSRRSSLIPRGADSLSNVPNVPSTPNDFLQFESESNQQKQSLLKQSSSDYLPKQHQVQYDPQPAPQQQQLHNHNHNGYDRQMLLSNQKMLRRANSGPPGRKQQRLVNMLAQNDNLQNLQNLQGLQQNVQNVQNMQNYNSSLRQPPRQVARQMDDPSYLDSSTSDVEKEDPAALRRKKYKAKSSIPSDLSSSNYAQQCALAAVSSRLPPYSLHVEEYDLLRSHLSYVHVTTYLNIRNGILRLWLSNPIVNVTLAEAAGCARDERYYGLAEIAYAWLIRYGYINYGCVEYTTKRYLFNFNPGEPKKPRKTIVIIGAGIAGLGCARQLENLLRRYSSHFADYENIPRIVVLEGRRRIGGRIYSAPLKSDPKCLVELGSQIVMGYGNGNPLGVLIRRQLGLPVEPVDIAHHDICDEITGKSVSDVVQQRGRKLYKHVMDRVAEYRNVMSKPSTVGGDQVLMKAAKDPKPSGAGLRTEEFPEYLTISQLEESNDLPKAYEDPGEIENSDDQNKETLKEAEFLEKIGVKRKFVNGSKKSKVPQVHIAPEPQGDVHPSLGLTMDSAIEQFQKIADLTPEDLRILNWYFAKLEYATGARLNDLSLANWDTAEGHKFTGQDSMVRDGFISLTKGLYVYPDKLDVRFKATVKVIEYDNNQCQVILENGDKIHCDRAVITVPLGVLKDRSIQCIPDLPQWKTDSIERLGFGVTNKVVLVYESVFWDENKDVLCICRGKDGTEVDQSKYAELRGEFFMFWNCYRVTGKPVVIGICSGEAARQMSNDPDDVIIENAKNIFEKVVPNVKEVDIVETVVTRWQVDPFARGSYSYVGLEATGADYDLLARPIGDSLFFAGEATNRLYPGTVHGAYLSGLRAANEVLTSLIGDIEMPYPLIPPLRQSHYHGSGSNSRHMTTPVLTPGGGPGSGLPGANIPGGNSQAGSNQSGGGASSRQSGLSKPPTTPIDLLGGRGYFEDTSNIPSITVNGDDYDRHDAPDAARRRQIDAWTEELTELRDKRISQDNERMRNDLIKELGERPFKPERTGANPFLIFQKDFWDKCRELSDKEKQDATNDPSARASRNEVRITLGKMWRELPEEEKLPYIEQAQSIKDDNTKKVAEYKKRIRQYDCEAEDFRRRWKEENASRPTEQEEHLRNLIERAGGTVAHHSNADKHKTKRIKH